MYFIALVVPADMNKQVLKWKTWMKERYGCEVALRSPAHITLVPPFWMRPELENNMIGAVNEFSLTQQGFIVQLNNFSHLNQELFLLM